MKIAINCRSFLALQTTGIGRYARTLVAHLARINAQDRFILYCRKNLFDRKRRLPVAPGRNFAVTVDHFGLGPDRIAGRVDVYHLPHPGMIDTRQDNVVVTVNDLVHRVCPETQTESARVLSESCFQDIVARARRIICISHSTREDLHRYYDLPRERTCVVHNGIDPDLFYRLGAQEIAVARAQIRSVGVEAPFLLFVGTIEPRKNLDHILLAFAQLRDSRQFSGVLVIAGMKGWMMEGILKRVEDLGLKGSVVFLGYLTDEMLRALYNCAEAFVMPSFYEGFGYPVVEAFACGAPVVTSNVSSLVEIAAGHAAIVPPASIEAIAGAMARIVNDPAYQQELREQGLRRARDFFLQGTAAATLKVYQEVAHEGGSI